MSAIKKTNKRKRKKQQPWHQQQMGIKHETEAVKLKATAEHLKVEKYWMKVPIQDQSAEKATLDFACMLLHLLSYELTHFWILLLSNWVFQNSM